MVSRKDNEEPLKALVFADDCGAPGGEPVAPIGKLLNVPILSWQLSVLARFGVKEAIVLSSNPIESLYEDPLGRMKITPLSSSGWNGTGDAIREVESRDGIRPVDDFLLVHRGAIFNVDVSKLVRAHKKRKEADRNWLITTTFRKGAGSASTGLVIGVDSESGTLLKYAEKMNEGGFSIDVHAENAGLESGGSVEICSNVMDVGLDVCAPDFLLEFRENFYYDKVRAYVKEKLDGGEAEIFGNRMYSHYLDSTAGEYGSRIQSLASFAQATADVLNGWMSPITVSSVRGCVQEDKPYDFQSQYVLEKSIVGNNVSVSVGSTILESVVGNNVTIGSDVTVSRSVLMDNSVIGDRCEIQRSIISENCTIDENCNVPRNCLLDSGVCIGPDFQDMCPHSFITLRDSEQFVSDQEDTDGEETDSHSDDKGAAPNKSNGTADIEIQEEWMEDHVGIGGKGYLIELDVSMTMDPYFVPRSLLEHFESDEEDELEGDGEDQEANMDPNGLPGESEIDEITQGLKEAHVDDSSSGVLDDSRLKKFNLEVQETIEKAYAEEVDIENTTLEVNSLKLVYHCSFPETQAGIVGGLASWALKSYAPERLYPGVVSSLQRFSTLVSKFSKDEHAHHVQVATGLASALGEHGTLVKYVFKAMSDMDFLTDDGILEWAASERKRTEIGTGNAKLLETLSDLLEWLSSATEEDSEDSED